MRSRRRRRDRPDVEPQPSTLRDDVVLRARLQPSPPSRPASSPGVTSRETIDWSATTVAAAASTGSMDALGRDPWPPLPCSTTSSSSAPAMRGARGQRDHARAGAARRAGPVRHPVPGSAPPGRRRSSPVRPQSAPRPAGRSRPPCRSTPRVSATRRSVAPTSQVTCMSCPQAMHEGLPRRRLRRCRSRCSRVPGLLVHRQPIHVGAQPHGAPWRRWRARPRLPVPPMPSVPRGPRSRMWPAATAAVRVSGSRARGGRGGRGTAPRCRSPALSGRPSALTVRAQRRDEQHEPARDLGATALDLPQEGQLQQPEPSHKRVRGQQDQHDRDEPCGVRLRPRPDVHGEQQGDQRRRTRRPRRPVSSGASRKEESDADREHRDDDAQHGRDGL